VEILDSRREKMEELFGIENFNIIQDEENYYFFRALNMADNRDVEEEITLDEEGKIARIRTDRERYIENPENGIPKYKPEDEISLEQAHDHIKTHYRKDTNCISLSSDSNVIIDYGRGNYKDRYVMVKIPKEEMGKSVKFAGEYMLEEIEKKVNEYISSLNPNDERDSGILQELDMIEKSQSTEEIKEIVKTTYKGEIDISKSGLRQGIQYRAPVSRFSKYQTLNDEQNLAKNKLVGKLTLLERKDEFPRLLPYASNSKILETVGSAFSSMELLHYGDIPGEVIQEVPSKIMDMFSLIQQVRVDLPNIDELKSVLVDFTRFEMKFNIPEDSILNREDKVKDNITIEEMYNLTEGRVAYGNANSIIKNVFYLAKSQARARELANVLNQITENNPKYAEVIDYIAKNGFEIEPEAITRHSNRGYQISEAVSLNLKKNEIALVEELKKFTNEELLEIMQKGGLSNTRGIITNTFSEVQEDEKISIDDYYAEAIIDLYDWQKLGIEEFTIEQRKDLTEKLKESDCVSIYKKLKEAEIPEKDIPKYLINLASKEHLKNILNEENYVELIKQNETELKQELSIPQIETYLGYYAVDGTELVLRDYQRNAVVKTDDIFENKKFASVVLPTGGGKSFVALTELMEHKDEKMLYLAPSNEILEQMKDYVIEYVHGLQGTLGKKSKEEIIAEVFPNITFETYPGLLAKKGKEVIKQEYGFIVLDELHRTGASEWEEKLDELLENQQENVRVLGITATPTRDMDDRNMANETALKLGYTLEEVQKREHIAMDMDLVEAIKLGLVVNPMIVSCEYSLKQDGRMEDLLETINSIEDENVKKEKLAKYEQLRRSLDNAQGIPEILQSNVKPGGKYIVFIPVTDKDTELEDEDGNKIGKKSGADKIKEYEKKIKEYLQNSGIKPKCYSMLGAYSDKKNEAQLKSFETDESEDTKFMIVMNKANEGLHVKGIDGIIWFRTLDENSKILYLQQLGRAIYSEDPNNPTLDEKRPVVIDLVNNTLNVDIDKDIKNNNRLDDLQLLSIVVDWVKMHNGLPDIESTNKTEQRYAATLYRIQNKYQDYLNGFENYPDLDEKKKTQIQAIIEKGLEIDLWDTQLPKKSAEDIEQIINVDTFEIKSQLMMDFVEFEEDIYENFNKSTYEEVIEFLDSHNGQIMNSVFWDKTTGKNIKRNELTKCQRDEVRLYSRWYRSKERKVLEEYAGRPIEEVPEEYRNKIAKLREYGLGKKEKTIYEEVIEFLETHNGQIMKAIIKKGTEKKKEEVNLYARWFRSKERKILEEYAGRPIEEVPEEYREKIAKLRGYGLGKTTYEEVIEFLETHNGQIMKNSFKDSNGKRFYKDKMTKEQNEELKLYHRWRSSEEKKILEEYAGKPIEEVPEEHRNKIAKLREYGLGKKEKTTYEEVIEFLETHNGHIMKGSIKNGTENEEVNLYQRWSRAEEKKVLEEYAGKPIEEVPEEYRGKIAKLREYGLGKKEKTTYEEVIEFLETHNGQIMKSGFSEGNRKRINKDKMTKEQNEEVNLYARWSRAEEKKILEEYAGRPIEEVPEEYRGKIAKLREYGLGLEKKKTKAQDVGEAGFEVGIGDIDKFDEVSQVFDSVVEKTKEEGKNKENT